MTSWSWLKVESLTQYIPAILAFVISLFVLRTALHFIRKRVKKFAEQTTTDLDDTFSEAINALNFPFYFTLSIFIALQFTQLGDPWRSRIHDLIYIVMAFYAIRIAQKFLVYSVEKAFLSKKTNLGSGLKIVLISVLWLLGGTVVLQHFGYNVSTLIAGLGIGGIAIAFALQNILADVFASFSIYFDRPFEIGDFIIIGADMGVVKKIGIKSTRITTLQGEELVVSNSELTTARIRNFKQMEERRILLNIGVIYETPVEKLRLAKQIISETISSQEHVRLDRVHLKTLAADSLVFETVFYIDSQDYLTYAEANESINFELLERFSKAGIEFAYPTQKLFISKE